MRQLVDDVIYPDAQAREEDGKRPSLDVIKKMAYVAYSGFFLLIELYHLLIILVL